MNTIDAEQGGEQAGRRMFEFSAERFDYQTAYDIIQQITQIKQTAPEHMAESEVQTAVLLSKGLNDYLGYRQALRRWSQEASGKVLERWAEGQWYDITSDLERPEVDLTTEMVDAALRYPNPNVLRCAIQSRLLNDDQMQYVKSLDLDTGEKQEIDAVQQRLAADA